MKNLKNVCMLPASKDVFFAIREQRFLNPMLFKTFQTVFGDCQPTQCRVDS
jgi:hypothetical protein